MILQIQSDVGLFKIASDKFKVLYTAFMSTCADSRNTQQQYSQRSYLILPVSVVRKNLMLWVIIIVQNKGSQKYDKNQRCVDSPIKKIQWLPEIKTERLWKNLINIKRPKNAYKCYI